MAINSNNFDPTAYGATPVSGGSSGGFNPEQYGATKVDTSIQPMSSDKAATNLSRANNGLFDSMKKFGENALPTAGAIVGGIGGAALGGLAGIESGPGAIATAYAGGVAGSGAGGAAGEALKEKLQGQPLQPGAIAKEGGIDAAAEGIGGPLLSAGGKLLSKAVSPITSGIGKVAAYVGDKLGGNLISDSISPAAVRATKLLQATPETMTKGDKASAILGGRMSPTLSGGGKYTASDTENRAGEMLAGKLSVNPVKNVPIIQKEISTQGKGAEKYLEQNAKPITNAEDYTMFQQKRIESEKYMTPTAVKAYDEQITVFQKVLKDFGSYNTANYYKALKDFESNVTEHLPKGKEVFQDEGGSARLQAAKDVRSVVRDMIGQKNPEFKGKMFDLASLYDARDTMVSKAMKNPSFAKTFAKEHPILTTAGAALGGSLIAAPVKNAVQAILPNE